jgi:hypothetical protein
LDIFGLRQPSHHHGLFRCWRGGREYRGVRTTRYTFCRDLNGPWLFYDNETDPFQLENLVNTPELASIQKDLDDRLNALLKKTRDEFLSGPELIKRSGYVVNPTNETVDYQASFNPANITKSPIA